MKKVFEIKQQVYSQLLYAWYHYPYLFVWLLPLTWVYRIIIAVRRFLYQHKYLPTYRAPVKVIVVGNLVVGGTGKTPMVIAITQWLSSINFKPGVITRGYRGGDEAILMSQKLNCPVIQNKNRSQAASDLSKTCDVIISDDGLQHYALMRDIEIVMMPDPTFIKNSFCLPAGPWREGKKRLKSADFLMNLDDLKPTIQSIRNLHNPSCVNDFRGKTVHAVCAIGMPWRFFALLKSAGIQTIEHLYPDHALITAEQLTFQDNIPVLITEKDAVKCQHLALDNVWVVKVDVTLPDAFKTELLRKLNETKIT